MIDPEDIDQLPPVVPSDNVVIAPEHTVVVPDIAVGGVFTATADVVAVAVTDVVPQTLVAVRVYIPALAVVAAKDVVAPVPE